MAGSDEKLTDDILVAFADQELAPEEMARLRPLIEADPVARQKVKGFKESAEQLKTHFATNVHDVTPDHIAQKIRAMPLPEEGPADDNVIPLSGFKVKTAKAFQILSAANGFQKIAASLVIGAFVGVGGGLQISEHYTSDQSESSIKFRGAQTSSKDVIRLKPKLILYSGDQKFDPGTTLFTSTKYRLKVIAHETGSLSLLYHEPNKKPITLIDGIPVNKDKIINFPEAKDDAISFTADVPFANFQLKIVEKSKTNNWYYVFGLKSRRQQN